MLHVGASGHSPPAAKGVERERGPQPGQEAKEWAAHHVERPGCAGGSRRVQLPHEWSALPGDLHPAQLHKAWWVSQCYLRLPLISMPH